jgi:hypothetical protein
MQKLMKTVIDKMIAAGVSDVELNLVLYVARYQDSHGCVAGVHYRDVCENAGMCPQSVYNSLAKLESSGIISAASSGFGDRDIQITGNKDAYGLGLGGGKNPAYLSLQHPVFADRAFLKMKPNAKLLAMLVLVYAGAGGGRYAIKKELFYDSYTQIFRVKKDTLRRYLFQMRRFFSVYIKNGQYHFVPKRGVMAAPGGETGSESDTDLLVKHLVKTGWRRHGKKTGETKPPNPAGFAFAVNFYKKHDRAKRMVSDCFLAAFRKCCEQTGGFSEAYVHKLMQAELRLAGAAL